MARANQILAAVCAAGWLSGCAADPIAGSVHKGPFVLGSTVTVSPTDSDGTPSGKVFLTQTLNDLGEFEVRAGGADFATIEGGGFYFDEVAGRLSTAPITLRAWYARSDGQSPAHVNPVTHLTTLRVQSLVAADADIAGSLVRAADELVTELGIGPPGFALGGAATDLDLAGPDSADNAYLFALSAILLSTAHLERPESPDAALQELMNTIAQDLGDDGLLDDTIRARLTAGESALDVEEVAANLGERVQQVGGPTDLPHLGRFVDGDGDGFAFADDCDDADPDAHPGAQEICDDAVTDEDCDGQADDDDSSVLPSTQGTMFADADGDGFGVASTPGLRCREGSGWAATAGDCDDGATAVHPGAVERCDGLDNDCLDGVPPEETDDDGDHYVECDGWIGTTGSITGGNDCDDGADDRSPGGVDTPWDDVDQDCTGSDHRTWTRVSSGIAFSCGLGTTGRLLCWGDITSAPAGTYADLDAGQRHACALDGAGIATCWGDDAFGGLDAPDEALGQVSAGDAHACGLRLADDTLVCWGRDDVGQVSDAPTGPFDRVSAGFRHTCALADGFVTCWGIASGIDDYGQVRDAPNTGGFTAISAGYFMSAALDAAGSLTVWGTFNYPLPPGPLELVQMGGFHLCGLSAGLVQCAGYDGNGQVTDAPTSPVQSLGVGYYHGCVVDLQQQLVCWGENGAGEANPP